MTCDPRDNLNFHEPPVQRSAVEWFGLIVAVAFALAVLFWLLPVAVGADVEPQAQLFRDRLYIGDSYRDFSCLWSRGDPANPKSLGLVQSGDTGDLDNVTLRGTNTFVATQIHLRESTQWESWHWKAFGLPKGIQPGRYEVLVNNRAKGSIEVVQALPVTPMKLGAGERTNSLNLAPGVHVRGYGTTLTGDLKVSPGCTIVGLTIDGSVTGTFDNCVFDSCTFRRGMVGPMKETDRGCLFKDCTFQNATAATCSSGLFLRCCFDGQAALGGHNFCNERSVRLAVINCSWKRTDRGLILRSTWGDSSDNLYAGIQFNDINATPNGCELFCIEGNKNPLGFNRNLIFCLRQSGCVGGVLFFDGMANDNIIDNCRVPVDICGMAEQRGNIIRESELDYVRINWPKDGGGNYTGATGTLLYNVACVGFKPSARGLASGDPKHYGQSKFIAVVEDGSPTPSTRATGLTVKDQAAGFLPTKGIAQ